MNKVVLIGRLTKDPELRYTGQGTPVARFTLAVNRRFKNKNGENEADFINCIAWRHFAENISKYFNKGSQIAISGSIQTGSYDNKDGNRVYTTEVVVEEFDFLEPKKQNTQNRNQGYQDNRDNQDFGVPLDDFHPMEEEDDDLPF